MDPLDFLFEIKQGGRAAIGRNVVIIGGGNTAMDAARTAYRLVGEKGAVTVVYRRTVQEMPADRGEVDAVQKEGIRIVELAVPLKVLASDNRVSGLLCSRTVLMNQGKNGRPVPIAVPGSEFEIACDTIIPAIGQKLAIDFLKPEELKTKTGSYKTRVPKLYIGGDALRGASTAINAIGDGRKAASEIIRTLVYPQETEYPDGKGGEVLSGDTGAGELQSLLHRKAVREFGVHPRETAPDQRRNFDLVISSYTPEEARKEAARCLQCDTLCNVCVSVCPNLANYGYEIEPVHYKLKKAVLKEDGHIAFEPDKDFSVEQRFQILNIRDLCNECGNCTTFCPTAGRPFADKPGLCLSVNSLNREGTGFYLSRMQDKEVLIYKEMDNIRTLTRTNEYYVYETNQVRATIHPATFELLDVKFLTPCVREFHFEFAAEMSVVMQGAGQLK
jgi:putative selenate reductase